MAFNLPETDDSGLPESVRLEAYRLAFAQAVSRRQAIARYNAGAKRRSWDFMLKVRALLNARLPSLPYAHPDDGMSPDACEPALPATPAPVTPRAAPFDLGDL